MRSSPRGCGHVTGSILGDESRYDAERGVPSWPDRYLQQHQLGPLSALTVNGGLVAFPDTFTEETRTQATPADDPPRFAAGVLTSLLRDRGVRVDGDPGARTAPRGARQLTSVTSPPLTGIVRQMLTQSDNQIAELLVKEIGYRESGAGTTKAGVRVLRRKVEGLGLPTDGVVIKDGSGLDHSDRLTCALIERLLAQAGPTSAVGEGLAVAGTFGHPARPVHRFTGHGEAVGKDRHPQRCHRAVRLRGAAARTDPDLLVRSHRRPGRSEPPGPAGPPGSGARRVSRDRRASRRWDRVERPRTRRDVHPGSAEMAPWTGAPDRKEARWPPLSKRARRKR